MRWHPGITMIFVWALCALAFILLPFQIETRVVTAYGFVLLLGFIVTFVAGSFLASPIMPRRTADFTKPLDLTIADRIIRIVSPIALVALVIDLASVGAVSLDAAFLERDMRTSGVLLGRNTGGTLWFQIAFLTYPIGYIAIVREILFRERIKLFSLAFYGLAPPVLGALAMGGRNPILYAFLIVALAAVVRRMLFKPNMRTKQRSPWQTFGLMSLGILAVGIAMNYFVQVFVVRADNVGGLVVMEQVAALNWGVSFDGPGSDALRSIIGDGNMYLVYVFIWYLIQGLIMSNVIFSQFEGDPTYGIYGIDLVAAITRRFDSQLVSNSLMPLTDINVYGFLPSAFGSLYVDFWFFALIPVFVWGYLVGYVYRRVQISNDARWVMMAPFATLGIFLGLMNTPLGYGNGLVIHIWLFAIVLAIRPVSARIAPVLSSRETMGFHGIKAKANQGAFGPV